MKSSTSNVTTGQVLDATGTNVVTTGDEIPIVSTSEADTTVMVKHGTTILIAGLIENRDEVSEDRIPVLGRIPIIGELFKSKARGNDSIPEKKELVIFLTPYIIGGDETFPETENIEFSEGLSDEQKRHLDTAISLTVADLELKQIAGQLPIELPEEEKLTHFVKDEEEKKLEMLLQESQQQRQRATQKVTPSAAAPRPAAPSRYVPSEGYFKFKESGYYSYYENLRNKILWEAKSLYPRGAVGYEAVVSFVLESNGRIKGRPQVTNDAGESLAESAIEAVMRAAPFEPFPRTMTKPEERFKVVISYE